MTAAERGERRRAAGQAAEEAFARSVRRLREERRWTVRELADEAGVDQSTVSRIELTGRAGPYRIAYAIAAALGSTVGAMTKAGAR